MIVKFIDSSRITILPDAVAEPLILAKIVAKATTAEIENFNKTFKVQLENEPTDEFVPEEVKPEDIIDKEDLNQKTKIQ